MFLYVPDARNAPDYASKAGGRTSSIVWRQAYYFGLPHDPYRTYWVVMLLAVWQQRSRSFYNLSTCSDSPSWRYFPILSRIYQNLLAACPQETRGCFSCQKPTKKDISLMPFIQYMGFITQASLRQVSGASDPIITRSSLLDWGLSKTSALSLVWNMAAKFIGSPLDWNCCIHVEACMSCILRGSHDHW